MDWRGTMPRRSGSSKQAYALHPTDDEINIAWIDTRPRAERLEKLADYAEHSDQISDESRAKMKTSLAKAVAVSSIGLQSHADLAGDGDGADGADLVAIASGAGDLM